GIELAFDLVLVLDRVGLLDRDRQHVADAARAQVGDRGDVRPAAHVRVLRGEAGGSEQDGDGELVHGGAQLPGTTTVPGAWAMPVIWACDCMLVSVKVSPRPASWLA